MRVIITGGTGFIGRALTASLVKDGHEVIILSRSPAKKGAGLPAGVRVEKWDAQTAAGWGALADGADAIVNLAGENLAGSGFFPTRWTEARKRLLIDSRVNAGNAVVEAVQQAANKPALVVQASGIDYYPVSQGKDVTESDPPASGYLGDVCVQWENATAPVEEMGVRRVVIRTGIVLSFKEGALLRLAVMYRLFGGGPIGSGQQPFPWIHIDDVIGAIRFLMENSQASGAYNLVAPNPLTNATFGQALGRVMRRPSFLPKPGFVFKLMFGEVADLLLQGRRVVPSRLLQAGYAFAYTEAEAALRDLYQRQR